MSYVLKQKGFYSRTITSNYSFYRFFRGFKFSLNTMGSCTEFKMSFVGGFVDRLVIPNNTIALQKIYTPFDTMTTLTCTIAGLTSGSNKLASAQHVQIRHISKFALYC